MITDADTDLALLVFIVIILVILAKGGRRR
jgi:hypothetical protein